MAFYTIHLAEGLSEVERTLAVRAGPRAVDARGSYPELLVKAGFVDDVRATDATREFVGVARRWLKVSGQLAAGLRAVEGDVEFEQFQQQGEGLVRAIEEGLLRRSLFLARAP